MSSNELIFLRGVPFLLSGSGKLFAYDATSSHSGDAVCIGSYNRETDTFELNSDWKSQLQPTLDAWHATLTPSERGKIPPAIKPSKQGRGRRTRTKTASSTSTTSA